MRDEPVSKILTVLPTMVANSAPSGDMALAAAMGGRTQIGYS